MRKYVYDRKGKEGTQDNHRMEFSRTIQARTRIVVRMWKVPSACLKPLPGTQDRPKDESGKYEGSQRHIGADID